MPAISRRNFLLFKRDESRPTVEISCQRLHMHYMEVQVTSSADVSGDFDPGMGEAPAVFMERTVDRMFADLERDLSSAAVLRVVDTVWLAPEDLRRRFEMVVQRFRAGGGTVEFAGRAASPR